MEEPNSAASNENSVPISCHKRDGEFDDSDPVTKKSKIDGKEEQKKEISKEGIEKEMSFIIEADAAEDKGSRHSMEDKCVVLSDASLEFPGKLRCAHYAIYDGHGGQLAAEYAQRHLHPNVLSAGLPLGCESCQKGHT